jgi:hypothetical protein
MRGSIFSLFHGVLLAQGAVAQQSGPTTGFKSSGRVLRREGSSDYECKCYPGDDCWPSDGQWQRLNSTVDGNLQVNIPPGAPCYNTFKGPLGDVDTYNEAKCEAVTSNWSNEQFQ